MIYTKPIQEKETDTSPNEALNSNEIEDIQILDGIFNIINEEIDIIMDNNTKIFNNQLKTKLNKKEIQNKYYKMELKQ